MKYLKASKMLNRQFFDAFCFYKNFTIKKPKI